MRNDPHTGEVIALDPSINSAGAALFRGGVLAASATIKLKADDDEPLVARCLRMAEDISEWVARCRAKPRVLVVEWPGPSWRGDVRDLYGLCGVNGAVAGILALAMAGAHHALEVVSFEPGEWSMGVPKEKTVRGAKKSPRALRIERALARHPGELEVWADVKYNDAIDAIGIGLHLLGRLHERVYPGSV